MQILISDANIFIDLEDGELLDKLFQLRFTFKTPDILYSEELEAQHSHLIENGLQLTELNETSMHYAMALVAQSSGPSTNDCFALASAKQEGCPLLTGDDALRKLAKKEGVVVMGTLWIVEQMVHGQAISVDEAKDAYSKMKVAGSRLPWDLAFSRLDEI
ncbi:nucleotide-binding protein [Hydrogenovibrio crunogenus]|uniref:Nucleotide-binding protein n=1 Tax=Hydrogenovibrio crunogenus TaxID=39765 RepID=A0A4V1C8M0_9GAMM|nr:PIN domain-containing protein [Hydrogenovibrio crunogenus]QBZ82374.1 nucleotide-binding protein [Hydrogenovibrio crunogenus]